MQTVLSTDGLPPREAYDYWTDVACPRLSASQAWTPHDRLSFSATLRAGALSDLQVLHWRITPLSGGWAEADGLILLFPSNRVSLQFADGSGFELDGGDACLIDGQAPPPSARIIEPTNIWA